VKTTSNSFWRLEFVKTTSSWPKLQKQTKKHSKFKFNGFFVASHIVQALDLCLFYIRENNCMEKTLFMSGIFGLQLKMDVKKLLSLSTFLHRL
jgi:hypothetical protein